MALETELSFTGRDQRTVLEDINRLLRARFPNNYPEIIRASIPNNIFTIFAALHGQRAFYQDQQALNTYLEFAFLPESIISIATKQLGYRRRLASSASVPVTLFPNPPQPNDITIRKGESITVNEVTFEATEDFVIPAGKPSWPDDTTTDIIVFNEGVTRTEQFTSNGEANQEFVFSQIGTIQGSVIITIQGEEWSEATSLILTEGDGRELDQFVANGEDNQFFTLTALHAILDPNSPDNLRLVVGQEEWVEVTAFTGAPQEFITSQDSAGLTTVTFGTNISGSAPPDGVNVTITYQIAGPQKRYTLSFDEDARATLRFGDGNSGIIPNLGAVISVEYRVGGGVRGNVRQGAIDGTIRGFLPSGAGINVRIFNTESGSGGEEAESLERIRVLAPLFAKSNNRAVRIEDWATLASSFQDPILGSPAFASAKIKDDVPEKNTIQVAIWSRDASGRLDRPNTPLKVGVQSFLNGVRTSCTRVEVIDGEIVFFDIKAQVILDPAKSVALVSNDASTIVQEYFNSTFVKPGVEVSIPEISSRLLDIGSINQVSRLEVIGTKKVEIDFGVGDDTTTQFTGFFNVPDGLTLVPGSFELTDGTQTASDDGEGNVGGNIDTNGTNTIDYTTAGFNLTLENAPTTSQFITAEARFFADFPFTEQLPLTTNSIDGLVEFAPLPERTPIGIAEGQVVLANLPTIFTPYTPNRIVFVGGYDNFNAQLGGNLVAFDNGLGGIVGDVQPGGTIDYETGAVSFTWNAVPPPVIPTQLFGRLLTAPDGVTTSFSYEIRTATAGGGTLVDIEALGSLGRLQYVLSGLSTTNVQISDAYDNGFGRVDGEALLTNQDSTVDYAAGTGTLFFDSAIEAIAGQDFIINIAPTTLVIYSAFSAFLTNGADYDKVLMADHLGRFYGDTAQNFPFAAVDMLCGRFKSDLTLPAITGRIMTISYDGFYRSSSKNLPVDSLIMPTFGTTTLVEEKN